MLQELPGGLVQIQIARPTPRISDSVSLGGLRIHFSNKFSVNGEAAGWGATLGEPTGLQAAGGCLQTYRVHSAVDFWGVIGDVSLLS